MSIEQGFAIRRNGTCIANVEIPCGTTGFLSNGMVGCCPNGLACPHAYNIDCCPQGKNCTMAIVATPRCSNSSWDLFDNGGYFCCERGLKAYNDQGTNVCADPGKTGPGVLLELIKAGETAVPSSSSASSTSTSATATSTSSTATSSQQSSQDSRPPIGAIVGGVVGGVAALAILALLAFLLVRARRRHQNNNTSANPYAALHQNRGEELGGREVPMPHQLDDTQMTYEAGEGKTRYAYVKEMPAETAPVELPAGEQPPR